MILEVGKSYRTRGGWKAVVLAIRPGEQGVTALHEIDNYRAFHDHDGSWAGKDVENHCDLIGEWDDWIEWNGGECPVDEGVWGEIRIRCGYEYHKTYLPGARWNHQNSGSDIIAYRVVQEAKEVEKTTDKHKMHEYDIVQDIVMMFQHLDPAEQSRALAYLNSRFGE